MKYLGIIPARKGSKRIPGKNTKLFAGKPLIEWTFLAAKASRLDGNIVSTDSEEILELSKKYPFISSDLRPEELSTDSASSYSVVEYVLNQLRSKNIMVENIVLLQPTSPLRTEVDINAAIELFEQKDCAPVQSYSAAECPPEWCCLINNDLSLGGDHKIGQRKSQDIGNYFRINGAIYVISVKDFLSTKSFVPANSYAYIMPRERSIDIDEMFDFTIAESLKKN